MKESFNLNPEHSSESSPKDHSAKSNLKNFGVGAVATIASLGISEGAVAQQGLLGRIKDKIEMVNHKHQGDKQTVEPEMKKDSIFYNNSNDHTGFKYPFDKEYKSDENFYRAVAYAKMSGDGLSPEELFFDAKESAEMEAVFKILNQEMKLNGRTRFYQKNYSEPVISVDDKRIHLGYIKIIDKAEFEDTKNEVFTTVIAIEISKSEIKIEKAEPVVETPKKQNEKSIENNSKDQQESKENINKAEGISQVEIKDIKDLKNLLKDYNQVLSSYPYEMEVSSIMKEILNSDLKVVVAEANAKSINIAKMLLQNKFDSFEAVPGVVSNKMKGHFGGGIIFYKELPGNSRKVMLLKLYKKSSSDNNINPTENLSKPLNKENKINLPEPSPVSNKPEKQPEYVKPTPENTANFIEERQKQFDSYKKANEDEFEKFKNSRENK